MTFMGEEKIVVIVNLSLYWMQSMRRNPIPSPEMCVLNSFNPSVYYNGRCETGAFMPSVYYNGWCETGAFMPSVYYNGLANKIVLNLV